MLFAMMIKYALCSNGPTLLTPLTKKLNVYDLFNYLFIYILVCFSVFDLFIFYNIFRRLSVGQIVLSDGMKISEKNLKLT
jgi:hypothetical protein